MTHVKKIAEFAIEAVAAAGNVMIDEDDPSVGNVHIRVGFHSGPVVSNVIGSLNPRYALFGDTMNTAARMEGLSTSDRIQCSAASARMLKLQAPELPLRRRGKISVKGKGDMVTYWVGKEPARAESTRYPKGFDRKPVVAFQSHEEGVMKKRGIRGHRALKIKMTGEVLEAHGIDPTSSAPMPMKSQKKRKENRRLSGSSVFSQ